MQLPLLDANPFSPILNEIARHGDNVAAIPVAAALEADPESGGLRWTVDVDVRIRNRRSFDCTGIGDTLEEAVRRALYFAKRELPK